MLPPLSQQFFPIKHWSDVEQFQNKFSFFCQLSFYEKQTTDSQSTPLQCSYWFWTSSTPRIISSINWKQYFHLMYSGFLMELFAFSTLCRLNLLKTQESWTGRNPCSKRWINDLLDIRWQAITQATASLCHTVMGFGQDRLTQNKLSILNGVLIMTLHAVSYFDNILPQNLGETGKGRMLPIWFWVLQSWKGVCLFSNKFKLTFTPTLTVCHIGLNAAPWNSSEVL